jgi:DNA repair protein RecN (Recombination protein N)
MILRELRVKNLAIIEEAQLTLSEGLTVLTGETGAGKSILVEAVDLILGRRASGDGIRSGCEEAEVEALFEGSLGRSPEPVDGVIPEEIADILREGEILIRRVISRSGRSRVTINGRLATLSLLEALGTRLAELHSQHQHQTLRDPALQLDLLDGFGGLLDLKKEVRSGYGRLHESVQRRDRLRDLARERSQREDFLRFQEKEIREADLQPAEDAALLQERQRLAHGERLVLLAQSAYRLLYEDEDTIVSRLTSCEAWVREMAAVDGTLDDVHRVMAGALLQLRDAAATLRGYADRIEFNPERLAQVEERLHRIERLKKKYGGGLEAVEAHLRKVIDELQQMESAGAEMDGLDAGIARLEQEVMALAEALSQRRREAAGGLQERVEDELRHLGMGQARWMVRIDGPDGGADGKEGGIARGLGPDGLDRATFLLSANPGEDPRPLARVASGGELSRVMLALMVALASADRTPTLIFDEVDTGIGGKIADEVGIRLKGLSAFHQVASPRSPAARITIMWWRRRSSGTALRSGFDGSMGRRGSRRSPGCWGERPSPGPPAATRRRCWAVRRAKHREGHPDRQGIVAGGGASETRGPEPGRARGEEPADPGSTPGDAGDGTGPRNPSLRRGEERGPDGGSDPGLPVPGEAGGGPVDGAIGEGDRPLPDRGHGPGSPGGASRYPGTPS